MAKRIQARIPAMRAARLTTENVILSNGLPTKEAAICTKDAIAITTHPTLESPASLIFGARRKPKTITKMETTTSIQNATDNGWISAPYKIDFI
jgi:hypothetical protein